MLNLIKRYASETMDSARDNYGYIPDHDLHLFLPRCFLGLSVLDACEPVDQAGRPSATDLRAQIGLHLPLYSKTVFSSLD